MLLAGQYSLLISSAEGPSAMRFALMPMLHHALDLEGCAQSCMFKRGNLGLTS